MIFVDGYGEQALRILEEYPFVSGVTTNSSILKKSGVGFSKAVGWLSGVRGVHFVQISLRDLSWMDVLKDPMLDRDKFIVKVAWVPRRACRVAREISGMGYRVCATAIYEEPQLLSAVECGVDLVAIYYDRMKRCGKDPAALIAFASGLTDVIVASLKNKDQVVEALKSGADHITVPPDAFEEAFEVNFPWNDFETFEGDFMP